MSDPVVERVAKALSDEMAMGPSMPAEEFYLRLAMRAKAELARAVVTSDNPIPVAKFVALQQIPHTATYKLIAQEATGPNMAAAVTSYLEREGQGELWVVEIKRVVSVTA